MIKPALFESFIVVRVVGADVEIHTVGASGGALREIIGQIAEVVDTVAANITERDASMVPEADLDAFEGTTLDHTPIAAAACGVTGVRVVDASEHFDEIVDAMRQMFDNVTRSS